MIGHDLSSPTMPDHKDGPQTSPFPQPRGVNPATGSRHDRHLQCFRAMQRQMFGILWESRSWDATKNAGLRTNGTS
jgi:hypothetical protein